MKKKFRVKSHKDFHDVISNGRKLFSKDFIIYYLNTDTGYNRVGISVSKKILKRAVDRNYQKRVIREILNSIYSKIKGSNDIVVIARRNAIDKSLSCKRDSLVNMLAKEKLLMEEFDDNK